MREAFLDDGFIERTSGVWRTLNLAAKDPHNPLLVPDKPWEGYLVLQPGTVLRDREGGRFRMWYNAQPTRERPAVERFLCMAVSQDGLHWDKPELGLVEFEGSRRNNILMRHVDWTHCVLDDPEDPDPGRRFKLAWWGKAGAGGGGICVAFSEDGVRWAAHPANPVVPRWASGDTFSLAREPCGGRYLLYHKTPRQPIRTVSRMVSDDFVSWRDSRLVLAPDAQDPPDTEFYGMSVFPCANQYAGLIWVYHTYSQTMDIQVASSRDGLRWERAAGRKLLMRLVPTNRYSGESFDSMMAYPSSGLLDVGDESWLYYSGFSVPHNALPEVHDGRIGLARLRRGGICSLDATSEGCVVTKPFVIDGGRLAVNLQAGQGGLPPSGGERPPWADAFSGAPGGAGSLSAEVQRPDGTPWEGYAAEDGLLASGDGVEQAVRWRTRPDLRPLLGKPARLKFLLRNAKLYGWQLS